MGQGFQIIFTPADRAWVGTPDFIRGVASLFQIDAFESLRIYREIPVVPDTEFRGDERSQKLLDRRDVPVEEAIACQRLGPGCSNNLWIGGSPLINAMADEVEAILSETIEDCWPPLEADLTNGHWIHYDYNGGDYVDSGSCCLTLYNFLGYPIPLDEYLDGFLKLDRVAQFQRRLTELSAQSWVALIDLA